MVYHQFLVDNMPNMTETDYELFFATWLSDRHLVEAQCCMFLSQHEGVQTFDWSSGVCFLFLKYRVTYRKTIAHCTCSGLSPCDMVLWTVFFR